MERVLMIGAWGGSLMTRADLEGSKDGKGAVKSPAGLFGVSMTEKRVDLRFWRVFYPGGKGTTVRVL